MNNYDAIVILESEKKHVGIHMRDAGMDSEYYKEMSDLFNALSKGISAIKKLDKIRKEAESL